MSDDVYGGTWRLADKVWTRYGIRTDAVDLRDHDAIASALRGDTPPRMVWIETPTNPLLKVIDISAVARLAATAGAITVVDNTFATPYLQRPLELGADLVMHCATKYLGGHSDVLGGPRGDTLRRARRAPPLPPERGRRGAEPVRLLPRHARPADAGGADGARQHERRRSSRRGSPAAPRWSASTTRACRTIRSTTSSRARCGCPARWSASSSRDGEAAARAFVGATRLFTLAESLGAVESLIEVPAAMTHLSVAESPLAVPPGLVRLSVGIESVDDLVADLAGGFAAAASV